MRYMRPWALFPLLLLLTACKQSSQEEPPPPPTTATSDAHRESVITWANLKKYRFIRDHERIGINDPDDSPQPELLFGNLPIDLKTDLGQRFDQLTREQKFSRLAELLEFTENEIVPESSKNGDFTRYLHFRELPQFQYSCSPTWNEHEEFWAELMHGDRLDLSAVAAQALWVHHSKYYAREILVLATDAKHAGGEWDPVRKWINESTAPSAIQAEIGQGNDGWGEWLAVLKPNPSLVPTLLANFESAPGKLTALALGSSKDSRALLPLITWLKSAQGTELGEAAIALASLGLPEAESALLAALDRVEDSWNTAHIYNALGEAGTGRSLPYLERQGETGGAINLHGAAQRAIQKIRARLKNTPIQP